MTEADWLACTDPEPMLEALKGTASDRKLRLFACAAYRCSPALMAGPGVPELVEAAEELADGRADWEDPKAVARAVAEVLAAPGGTDALLAAWAVGRLFGADAHAAAVAAARMAAPWPDGAGYARCVFGRVPPGGAARPAGLLAAVARWAGRPPAGPGRADRDQPWVTPAVVRVARGIYEDRAFYRLPVLVDALRGAGCEDADILGHCRGPGPHVRGCWVVDLISGKG
jgi:hypothetical protein